MPPCVQRPLVFDPDKGNPAEAIQICRTCPVTQWCATERDRLVADGYIPWGIWAGAPGVQNGAMDEQTLRRRGMTKAERMAAEEKAFDDDEAYRAYRSYRKKGDRSDWACAGNRVYERRAKQRRRKPGVAA